MPVILSTLLSCSRFFTNFGIYCTQPAANRSYVDWKRCAEGFLTRLQHGLGGASSVSGLTGIPQIERKVCLYRRQVHGAP